MKNIFKLFFAFVVMLGVVLLAACGNDKPSGDPQGDPSNPTDNTDEILDGISFLSQSLAYDGEEHKLTYLGEKEEDFTYVVTPEDGHILPGDYEYKLTVSKGEKSRDYTATLTIEKLVPTYTGPESFDVVLHDPTTQPVFTFDSDVNLTSQTYFDEKGTFEITLTTDETDIYAQLPETKVTVNVVEKIFNYSYPEATILLDDIDSYTHLLVLDEGKDPIDESKYEIRYENNVLTSQGDIKAKAEIVDKASGNVIETFRTIVTGDYSPNAEFEAYVFENLQDYLEGDQMAINLFLVDYKEYGLEHGTAEWYSFDGYDYTEEDYQNDITEIRQEREKLNDFGKLHLSNAQLISYRRIDEMIKFYENILAEYEYEFIAINYVDQFGGYTADFPDSMESYTLRTKEDVEDLITYIESTASAFDSYYDYIVAKKEIGYGLSEFTLTSFNDYLKGVIDVYDTIYGLSVNGKYKLVDSLAIDDSWKKDVHDNKRYPLVLYTLVDGSYVPLEEVTAGTYKLAIDQKTLQTTQFATGVLTSSNKLETSDEASEACDVIVEEFKDGYSLKIGDKYIELGSQAKINFVDERNIAWHVEEVEGHKVLSYRFEYYLINILLKKLENAKTTLNLGDDEYNQYYARLSNALRVTLYNAHKDLYDKVENFVKTENYFKERGYTGQYYGASEDGHNLYYALLQNRLGTYNVLPKDYVKQLEAYMNKYYDLYMGTRKGLSEKANRIINGGETVYDYGDDILSTFVYLKQFASTIVYPLDSEPQIDVAWMDPTATENTTTAAYYMKSALDSFGNEYIHLNGRVLADNNYETMSTIAHEGYPGHLYAYVNTKENPNLSGLVKLATYTGHGEGWAKYVEYVFHDYVADQHKETGDYNDWKQAGDNMKYWDTFIMLFYARCDYGINYEGWQNREIKTLLKKYSLNSAASSDLFDTLNEIPSQYAPYGYGQAVFIELHDIARQRLGNFYDEKEFNKMILEHGWCSLDSLKEYAEAYIENQEFVLFGAIPDQIS